MCGRFFVDDTADIEEIEKILADINSRYKKDDYKTGEIFPTNTASVVVGKGGVITTETMRWGFPKWDGKGEIINARAEDAANKSMFKALLTAKRCAVPSTGFFEWSKADSAKNKDKFLFTIPDSPVLYMAGLYDNKKTSKGPLDSFVILTRPANRFISDIHDRMPVILPKDELDLWLGGADILDRLALGEGAVLERRPA